VFRMRRGVLGRDAARRYKDRAGDIRLMVGVWGAVRSFGRDAARHVATKNTVSIEVSIPLRVLREKMPRSPRVHRP